MVRIAKALGVAAEGAVLSLSLAALAIVLILLRLHLIGAMFLSAAFAIALFFRDPERFPSRTEDVVLSGADGKVTDVSEVTMPNSLGEKCRRVSVFMSPLNVHVNRAPVSGAVVLLEHTRGEFRAAFRDEASEKNERNLMVFGDLAGRKHAMMQVAGYLARRIVCRLRVHDRINCGQRIGLIMFGSRVDHFLPSEYQVRVAVGSRVRAGESVIGEFVK